eukprot:5386472-Alexandrium_andersonii.AAC.1
MCIRDSPTPQSAPRGTCKIALGARTLNCAGSDSASNIGPRSSREARSALRFAQRGVRMFVL